MKAVTAIIHKGEKFYVGECVEIDVITQGETIDETLQNLKEGVALYFKEEKAEDFELPGEPSITCHIGVEEYAKV